MVQSLVFQRKGVAMSRQHLAYGLCTSHLGEGAARRDSYYTNSRRTI